MIQNRPYTRCLYRLNNYVAAIRILPYHFQTMSLLFKCLSLSFALLLMMTSNSCSTLSYYRQSITGHFDILIKSRPIEAMLKNNDLTAELRKKLLQSIKIRKYASDVLFLPANDSYSSYVDLDRKYVLWNIVATPEFSLEPLKWCYLIVGCLTYRGYFSKDDATMYAEQLKSKGYDVHVAGVTAYSTLGWFDDPVINTMLQYDFTFLAKVIYHELAHQLIYFADDTEFNEAFADTVAEHGVRRWLTDENLNKEVEDFEQSLLREKQFNQLVLKYKVKLENLYQSSQAKNLLLFKKETIFRDMKSDYEKLRISWNGHDDYKTWFDSELNNAKLALVLTYKDLVPEFFEILNRENFNLEHFYQAISQLENCNKTERRQYLRSYLQNLDC